MTFLEFMATILGYSALALWASFILCLCLYMVVATFRVAWLEGLVIFCHKNSIKFVGTTEDGTPHVQ